MKKVLNLLWSLVKSAFLPIIKTLLLVLEVIFEAFNYESETVKKIIDKISKELKRLFKITFAIWYTILILSEAGMLLSICQGNIQFYEFNILFSYTIIILGCSFGLIKMLRKNSGNLNFNYVIYIQILILLPMMAAFWIAYIEGKNLYLSNFNADNWISLFSTIILYFSGCFIGLITLYKTEKENVKNN